MSNLSIGQHLRQLRKEKKWPLRKVAALLDMDVAILSKAERGLRKLTKEVVIKLAKIYDTDEEELLVLFLSDKILYEIGTESFGIQALEVAESQVQYQRKSRLTTPDILQLSKSYFISNKKIRRAWLFGSVARGEDTFRSDIDIMIDVPEGIIFTLFDLAEIQESLQLLTQKKVDLVMLNGISSSMKTRIENDKILIYEA